MRASAILLAAVLVVLVVVGQEAEARNSGGVRPSPAWRPPVRPVPVRRPRSLDVDEAEDVEDETLLSRTRREGEVNVDVERNRNEKPRVTVSGQRNVWKDAEGRRRVDVSGSADNRGGRRAGVSYKW